MKNTPILLGFALVSILHSCTNCKKPDDKFYPASALIDPSFTHLSGTQMIFKSPSGHLETLAYSTSKHVLDNINTRCVGPHETCCGKEVYESYAFTIDSKDPNPEFKSWTVYYSSLGEALETYPNYQDGSYTSYSVNLYDRGCFTFRDTSYCDALIQVDPNNRLDTNWVYSLSKGLLQFNLVEDDPRTQWKRVK
jgi:hypothetical protein